MTLHRLLLVTVCTALLFVHPANVLAASGWLLVTPPVVEKMLSDPRTGERNVHTGEWDVEEKLPYSKWEQYEAYDKADNCEFVRSRILNESLKRNSKLLKEWDEQEKRYQKMLKEIFNPSNKHAYEQVSIIHLMNPRYLGATSLAESKARCVPADAVYPAQPKR